MKIRSGFVSNSSSSSFIMGAKGNLSKNVLRKILKEALYKSVDYYIDEIAEILLSSGPMTIEEAAEEEGYSSVEEYFNNYDSCGYLQECVRKGMKLYIGAAGDDGELAEKLLCDMDMHVNTPDLIIEKDGGY